jgi:dienelactone hydrolase
MAAGSPRRPHGSGRGAPKRVGHQGTLRLTLIQSPFGHHIIASTIMRAAMVLATVTSAAAGLSSARAVPQHPSGTAQDTARPPVISTTEAPAGAEKYSVRWVQVNAAGVGTMLAAVARPTGDGPFPSVLLLHGSHGFAPQYVQLAEDLARHGVMVMAPCWFAGGAGQAGSRFVSPPIACPDAPPMPMARSGEALRTVQALVEAARALPDSRGDRVALVGHSRGGGAALYYAEHAKDVKAVVLNSSGYPDELTDVARNVSAPVLVLHGVLDGPASGGTAFTSVHRARAFEAALKQTGKRVEAKYYERGDHNGIFSDTTQYADEVVRIATFLRRELTD